MIGRIDRPPLGPALLFCPADRPDRYRKAAAAADAVILDLEDAVAPTAKPAARCALIAADPDPDLTAVRINAYGTPEFDLDLEALHATRLKTVVLAKASSLEAIDALHGFDVIVLCETARGIQLADRFAECQAVTGLTWGSEDLAADLGAESSASEDGTLMDFARYARSRVLLAAAASGKPAWDTVYANLVDTSGLTLVARDAAASGFAGSLCIHPRQVRPIRDAFLPESRSISWAIGVLAAAAASQGGVTTHDGQMIDGPIVRRAAAIVARSRSESERKQNL